jgi:hypothetical protein
MATCAVNKIDSNATGLSISEEECLGIAYPEADNKTVWYPLEPNTYSDFGGQITTVARAPINASRQNQKGVVTDLAASGGFNQDFTNENSVRLMQGFLFATAREKATTDSMNVPMTATQIVITAVDATNGYVAGAGLTAFKTTDIILAENFGVPGNNGLKHVSTVSATDLLTVEALTAEAAPPANAKLTRVGTKFTAADISVAITGANGVASLVSTTFDFTTLGVIAGEWIYLGSDTAANRFVNNVGFARVGAVAAHNLTLDKTDWVAQAEAGTGKTIELYLGTLIRNEQDPNLIVRRTYQLERTLGQDASGGTQSEILIGAACNEFTLNIPSADKMNADFTFVATDNEARTGTDGLMYGTRAVLAVADAYNTSSDFNRIKLSLVDDTTSNVTPLFAFLTTMTLTIKNNVSAAKAVANLGAIDLNIGTFDVGGSITAYFASVEAVQAVRNNASCTLDMIAVKNNKGILFDVPLLTLGNGRIAVTKDQAITLPLDSNGAQSSFGNTLTFQSFPYLPTLASTT